MKNFILLMALLFAANAQAQSSLIKDINAGTSDAFEQYIYDFVGYGNSIYFVAKDLTSGFELWKSDGTSAGTIRVKDINSGTADSKPRSLVVANNKLFFTAQTAAEGRELWVTDGTEAGTKLVKNIGAGAANGAGLEDNQLVVYNNNVYFTANNGTLGYELWKSDGTDAGTVIVKDLSVGSDNTFIASMVVFQNKLFFFADSEMYSTDGTAAGTVKIKSFATYPSFYSGATLVYNNKLYLSIGYTGYYSSEPWISDGTDAGTKQLKDIVAGASEGSVPENFYGFKNHVYMDTRSFWRTDGTEAGTVEFSPNSVRLYQQERINFVNDGTKMYFAATSQPGSFSKDIWVTDGTVAGTKVIKYINSTFFGSKPDGLVLANGKCYFSAENSTYGRELWVTDGTDAGTKLASDVVAGNTSSNPENNIFWNGNIYFVATTAANGKELWKFAVTTATTDLTATKDLFKTAQNPVNQSITIEWINAPSQILTLTNAVGQVVATHKTKDNSGVWQFNSTDLPDGLYLLKSETNAAYQVEKIVVQH
jgi:ELWxxDGT repeat protein